MEAQTIKAGDVEVYENKVYIYEKEYIDMVSTNYNKSELAGILKKTPTFRGMLKYIYNNVFKPQKGQKHNSNIDYGDVDLLGNIWDTYTGLCYKYLQYPTMLDFSLFTGIRRETLSDWTTGHTRSGGNAESSEHTRMAKKWRAECEGAAYSSALSGNPGAMFILKANYGYKEDSPSPVQNTNQIITRSPEEIAAQYGKVYNTGNLELPEVPD